MQVERNSSALYSSLSFVGNMGLYSILDNVAAPLVSPFVDELVNDPREKFKWRRRLESWKYGSGGDYKFPPEEDGNY